MTERLRRLNFIALAIVVTYAMVVSKVLSSNPLVNPVIDGVIIFVSAIELHRLLVDLLFRLVPGMRALMKLYWGRMYVDGLWSYTYTLDGADDGKIYFGVWRFDQTLYSTRVVGFGLSENFIPRSRVRSVSEIMGDGHVYEFVNIRTDSVDPGVEYYSRTAMYFELNKNRFFRYPTRMRGRTIVYGGPLSGRICNNLFIRHELARTEQDVIDDLEENFHKYGSVHPRRSETVEELVASTHPLAAQ